MTNEERDLISQFVSRVGGPPASGFAGSVPQVNAQPLAPVDPQADQLLAELFTRYPEARYRLTQFAFIQEHAVAAAQNQIQQLQAQIQQMAQQLQAQAAPPAPSPWGAAAQQPAPSRGLVGGVFGGGQPAPQPQPQAYAAPPPQYAHGYQQGMFQNSGTGFLGGALRTAAGVAGGVMAAEALTSLFSGGHHGGSFGGGFGGGGFAGGGYGQDSSYQSAGSPWTGPQYGGVDPMDQGGAAKSYPADQSSWAQAQPAQDTGWQDASVPAQDSGWQDASASSDSGWTDSGSDFDNT